MIMLIANYMHFLVALAALKTSQNFLQLKLSALALRLKQLLLARAAAPKQPGGGHPSVPAAGTKTAT